MRQLVHDTITAINLHSNEAENLICGTIAQESVYGKYRRQLGGGPALGICQMEPDTFHDIVFNFLHYKNDLSARIMKVCGVASFDPEDLINNDRLAISMCRVHYLRVREAIPGNLEGWARYWKKYYNTYKGKGTIEEYIKNFNRYVLPDSAGITI
jgi:hypothetical protein